VAAAALAIPDLAALIFSAYCSGIRVDFHPVLRKNWIHWSICPWKQN